MPAAPFGRPERKVGMVHWAAVFLVIALISAVVGFSGIAVGAAAVGKLAFIVFLGLAGVSLLVGRRVVT